MHASAVGTGWEQLFWLVFERSSNPIALVDEQRRFVELNDSWLTLVGRRRADMLGGAVDSSIRPSARARAAREWQAFLRSGEYTGTRALLRADGSEVDIEFAARLASIGERRLAIYVAMAKDEHRRPAAHAPRPERGLTNREREVVTLIALGQETGQIAEELSISDETVRTTCATRCPSSELTRERSWSQSPCAPARRFTPTA